MHLGVLLGTALCTAILVGALTVGDSVRYSLQSMTRARLGKTEYALSAGDRFFRSALAADLANDLKTDVVSLIQARGIAINPANQQRVNAIQVNGIDPSFWTLWDRDPSSFHLSDNEAIVNQRLAERLGLNIGDELLIRVEKIDQIPQDVPLVSNTETSVSFRLIIKAIASDYTYGRFSLRSNQIAPFNLFMPLSRLTDALNMADRTNTLLVADNPQQESSLNGVQSAFRDQWTLSDAGLELCYNSEFHFIELVSDRIFLDPPIVEAGMTIPEKGIGVLTYFVNGIRSGQNEAPYSFVSAIGDSVFSIPLQNDDIIINQWLANDIHASKGDEITLSYFVIGSDNRLTEDQSTFKVKEIIPIQGMAADRSLMPQYPGLADADHCREWDPGIPIDLNKIRDKDENYWDRYKGTPKAFISLSKAQSIWKNRFGNLTAIRYMETEQNAIETFSDEILTRIDPISLGFVFHPFKELGLQAGRGAVDFGQLFLALSFFIVLAALLLTSLLFVFGIENRSEEIGTLSAVGFSQKQIQHVQWIEGFVIALSGSLLGILLSIFYNYIVLKGLDSVWQGAVGTTDLRMHFSIPTILTGTLSGLIAATGSIWLTTKKSLSKTAIELQKSIETDKPKPWKTILLIAASMIGLLMILLLADPGRGKEAAGLFFGAGFLLLTCGLLSTRLFLIFLRQLKSKKKLNIVLIGFKNISRKSGRSLMTIGLIACGIFIIIGVGANRNTIIEEVGENSSGTGGYGLYGETVIPILDNLNDGKTRTEWGLIGDHFSQVRFLQMRIHEGDDASCLNLNRVQNPRILGINPNEFTIRGSFSFVKTDPVIGTQNPWPALNQTLDNNVIPAIADETVIVWGLNKSVGDTLTYTDTKGESIKLKLIAGLANSIFQGNVLISEQHFLNHFSSNSGYRAFLVDVPLEKRPEVIDDCLFQFQDMGLELTPTENRLAEFNQVENTYLSIFTALGALGMMIGSIGLGIVILRNVMERRNELAILRAVGYSRNELQKVVLSEHWILMIFGLMIGIVSALIAALPALRSPGIKFPFMFMIATLTLIILNGLVWTLIASRISTSGDLISALRNE